MSSQKTLLQLTDSNYYSLEADRQYMSCSLFQDFLDCEARAMAKLEGRFEREESEAFLVGNYFHSFFEGTEAFEKFCTEHFDDIFKYKIDKKTEEPIITGKYAPYIKADKMIETIKNDELCMTFVEMPGENEKIFTGTLFGIPWKAKFDKYVANGRLIIDYKTCKSIYETNYNSYTKQRETFVETYGYLMRAAVYTELEKQNLPPDANPDNSDPQFILMCVSKEEPPDKELVSLKHRVRYEQELEFIKERLPRMISLMNHQQAPRKCGVCEYCRSVKKLTDIKPYYKLMPEFREAREDDFESDFYKILEETKLP